MRRSFREWARAVVPDTDPEVLAEHVLSGDEAGMDLLRRWLRAAGRPRYVHIAGDVAAAAVALLRETALHRGELVRCQQRHLDREGDVLVLRVPGARVVKLSAVALDSLRVLLRDRPRGPEAPLLAHEDGSAWTARQLRYVQEKIGGRGEAEKVAEPTVEAAVA